MIRIAFNVPLILKGKKVQGIIFCMREKHRIGYFEGFLEIKKVDSSSKNPEK